MCDWFARCENDAIGRVAHPVLGKVDTCRRCADKLDLTFVEAFVRIDIEEATEGMEETPWIVTETDEVTGEVLDRCFYAVKEDAYQHRIARREHEERLDEAERLGVHPLEIEFAPFGPAWEREQRDEGRPF